MNDLSGKLVLGQLGSFCRRMSRDACQGARDLGAERRGKVASRGGYFGAEHLAAEVAARFRVPEGGGRSTDPSWDEQRLIRLSATTLEQLEQLAERVHVSPMQVAAVLLERAGQSAAGHQ